MMRYSKALRAALALALLAAGAALAAADLPAARMPDSSALRSRYWDSYFSAPRARALARSPSLASSGQATFRLRAVDGAEHFYLIVSPLAPGADRAAEPPLYAQGTWILKRSRADGRPVQAKVFLRSDPGCFVRIYPEGDRSRLDLVLYGAVLNREVALPMPFERAFAASFADIVDWTSAVVDWDILAPRPGQYAGARALVSGIRSRLGSLRYADDGALDAAGRPVLIATGAPQAAPEGLNCSGFAKWVVDGLYRPITGASLDPRAMAEPHPDSRGSPLARSFEGTLDPYFGLDWTRNLAAALMDAAYAGRRHGLHEADVEEAPFALFAAEPPEGGRGAVNGASIYEDYPAPDRDCGYAGRGLKALLYVLAARDPGAAYLASLSRRGAAGPDADATSMLLRHYHVAVLIPYFEEDGSFRVAVFESCAETGIDKLAARVGGEFVHLSRLPPLPDFDPPALP